MPGTSYTPREFEAAHSLLELHYGSSNHSNLTQAVLNLNQTLPVASDNNAHRASYQVNPIPGGSFLVPAVAPVQNHGASTSCGVGQVHMGTANQVFMQPIVIRPAIPYGRQIVCTLVNTNEPQAPPVVLGQTGSQQAQLPSAAQGVDQSGTQQATTEQAMSMPPPQGPDQAATAPNANQASTQCAQSSNQTLQEFLLRQQRIAGIAPQDMVKMPSQQDSQQQSNNKQGNTPSVIQISRDGNVSVPRLPPARFNVTLPTRAVIPSDPANHAIRRQARSPELSGVPENQRSRPLNGIARHHGILADPGSSYPIPSIKQNPSQAINGITSERGYSFGSIGSNTHSQNIPHNPASGQSHDGNHSDGQHATQASSTSKSQEQATKTSDENAVEDGNQSEDTKNQREFVYLDIPGALTSHPNLELMVLRHLPIKDFLNMRAASRRVHQFVKKNTNMIVMFMASKVHPGTAKIFPYACYKRLRVQVSEPTAESNTARPISMYPTLKWLSMLSFRSDIIREIMCLFNERGFQLTPLCESVLSKIWFLMDIPDNARRIWTIKNQNLWTDSDIFHGIFVLAQIESCFTGHKTGTPRQGLRRLLMAQRNLVMLRDALKGTAMTSHYQVLKAFIRWNYKPLPHERFMDLFAVPHDKVGSLQYEYYGYKGNSTRLQRPDELILRECTARQLDIFKMYCSIYVQTESRLAQNFCFEYDNSFVREVVRDAKRPIDIHNILRTITLGEY